MKAASIFSAIRRLGQAAGRRRIRRPLMWGAAAGAVAVLLVTIETGRAQTNCNYKCTIRAGCNNADITCTGCDPIGGGSYTCPPYDRNYNPANTVIKSDDTGGGEQRQDQGDVICWTEQQCDDSAGVMFQVCSGLPGSAMCSGTFPFPSICYVCTKTGTPFNYIVRDWECLACGEQ